MRSLPIILAYTDGDQWRPGIGDPSVMGWVTVAAYFITAILCLRVASSKLREARPRSLPIFWSVLASLLFVLGVNKQLDLQTWLTLTAKQLAIAQGWYEQRRVVQFVFILLMTVGGVVGFVVMWRLVYRFGSELWIPLLGFCLLITFVVVRAASFHHVDQFLKFQLAGVKMNWLFELSGITLIAAGTLLPRLRCSQAQRGSLHRKFAS